MTKLESGGSFYTKQFNLLIFSNFLFSCSFTMLLPELPAYLTALGGSDYKGYIIALFTLMAGLSRPFSGKLTDTIGRVPVMIFGSLICVLCGLLYPILTTVAGFLFLRFFHGFSTGFKPTATAAYGADVVHPSQRSEALGALSIGYTLGMSLGPLIGSTIVQLSSFNIMFYASSLFAFGSVAILFNVKETLPNVKSFELKLLKINKTEIFDKTAIKPSLIMLLMAFSYGSMLTLIPDYSTWLALPSKGIFYATYTFTALAVRLFAGKKLDEYSRIAVLKLAAFIMLVAMLILCLSPNIFLFITAAAIFGLSHGIYGPTLAAWTVDLCKVENRGKAVSSMYIALEAGIGLGAIISAAIFNNNILFFKYAFGLAAAFCTAALVLLYVWQNKFRKVAIG
ncbi:MAG: MFS transporter [Chitinophagaceae bacterium]